MRTSILTVLGLSLVAGGASGAPLTAQRTTMLSGMALHDQNRAELIAGLKAAKAPPSVIAKVAKVFSKANAATDAIGQHVGTTNVALEAHPTATILRARTYATPRLDVEVRSNARMISLEEPERRTATSVTLGGGTARYNRSDDQRALTRSVLRLSTVHTLGNGQAVPPGSWLVEAKRGLESLAYVVSPGPGKATRISPQELQAITRAERPQPPRP